MTWKCGDCDAEESSDGKVLVDAVCHHCGKPLCRSHQQSVIDDAFAATDSTRLIPVNRIAVHCESCRRAHHPRATLMDGRPQ
ncbi:hypothetical protein AB0J55_11240 [Amycolatopsis sp. NPDC049688]|uniref:hypothetical protein n=1 Tax=Amycolatopsis sp. NPDC049688 TaxID=3154733 RepID=UPI00341DAB02